IPSIIAFYDFSQPKIYETSSKILLKVNIPKVTGKEDIVYRGGSPSKEDQMNLLTSRIVAEKVLDRLNLRTEQPFLGARDPVRVLLSMVRFDAPDKSNLVFIRVRGHKPLTVTSIANVWSEEFIKTDLEQRLITTKYGISWLGEQLDSTLKKLEEAEKRLNDFVRDNRIGDMPEAGKRESLIEGLKRQKSNLERDAIESSKKYGDKHPKLIELTSQLEAVEQKLKEEEDSQYALQDKSLDYKILVRDVDIYKNLYTDFLKRIKELEVSKEMVSSNVQVIDQAQIPMIPISPQPTQDILKGIIASLMLGIGLCYFLEYADSTLKTSEDVEFYTKMPFLAYIPSARREARRNENKDLITALKPYSQVTEAFRNLRVSLIFSFPEDRPLQTLMVTSSIAKEGKSFVSTSLAISFAQTNEETLLIDADMRRGRLSNIFELKTKNGLSSLLAGICSLEEAVVSTSVPNLYLIPTGPSTPNPAELLNSKKLVTFLETAKSRFKRIIIDAPPALGVSDTLMLGDKCDGAVFVIKTASTSLKLITEVRKLLGKKIKIIGAVLNNVSVETDRYYSYYSYYHYTPKKA
ncbi:MAG: polysaccharide biosynthesis tyrosine autokinase, partial [Candidatus Omnitrophica bacterium]|nr:polysaccharide biosynthesis tyrosine autokinase [Candidatus Omnitrophota bacterium]